MASRCGFLAIGIAAACYVSTPALAVEQGATAEISWERLNLPSTHLTFRTQPATSLNTTPVENHNGSLDGARVDLSYGMATSLFGGSIVGVKGFFSRDTKSQNMACAAGSLALGFCDVLPLVDAPANPVFATAQNVFGSGNSGINYLTSRRANHWGVALEVQPGAWNNFGAKSKTPVVQSITTKAGLAFRRIGQNTTITGNDAVFGTTLNYDEKLSTSYTGAYLGLTASQPLGAGVIASLDGEAGLYWAHTAYDGTMLTSSTSAGNSALSLSSDRATFIGSVKAALDKDLGNNWKVGVFTRAEWYSYAPEMNYNSVDRNGAVLVFSGPNSSTSIGNSSAWAWSVGARVSLKLN
jgi:hypothetical protein